jgi:hypothetical protein
LIRAIAIFVAAMCVAGESDATPRCASTIEDLRAVVADPAFALRWRETTMDDGKPLEFSLTERRGTLFLEFVKTGEGLWAEGAGVVCRDGSAIVARIAREQIRLGPAANGATRYLLSNGGEFTLTKVDAGHLRIETFGWGGTFSARGEP